MRVIENHDIKYDKLKIVIDKLHYIEETFNITINFDRRWANHYKLIMFDKEYTFNTYSDVIDALNIIIDLEGRNK